MLGFELATVGAFVVCVVWSPWRAIRWDGKWHALAIIPLAAIMLWGLKYCDDPGANRTPNTQLPFEVIEAAVLIALYMLVIRFARGFTVQRELVK